MLTSSSWADCGAADRAGLVSWMVSTGLRRINHISHMVVLGLSVYCLTVNLAGQYGYNSPSAPSSRTPMIQGWATKKLQENKSKWGVKAG